MSSSLNGKKIVIFGGTGFVGNHLVRNLCQHSCQIEIISRFPEIKRKKFYSHEPGQIRINRIEAFNQENLDRVLMDADVVFNLIGILFENKKNKFEFAHYEIPSMIALAAKKNKVEKLIHLSALNIEKVPLSKYASSKLRGENSIKSIFNNVIIIRPSVVFGKGDNFLNFFIKMSKFSPFLPLIGTPDIKFKNYFLKFNFQSKVRFQPIYVDDLIKFMIHILKKRNGIFELAGPNVKSFDEIFDVILNVKKRKRIYLPLPFIIAEVLAIASSFLPRPLITSDQLKLLKVDSISDQGLLNLEKYIKNPKSIESTVRHYL